MKLDKIEDFLSVYGLWVVALLFFIGARIFPSPDSQKDIFLKFFSQPPQTSYDLPSVWVWFFLILIFIFFIDTLWISEKAFRCDYIFIPGISHAPSCFGSSLKVVGEWCYIRTEGLKEFGIEGNSVLCNPATHTHRVGNCIIMEGQVVKNTLLTHIPSDIKDYVRATRGGIFGSSVCSVGYMSVNELMINKEFRAESEELLPFLENGEKGKIFQTHSFIDKIRDLNIHLNQLIELNNSERESISRFLNNVIEFGKGIGKAKEQSIFEKITGGNR